MAIDFPASPTPGQVFISGAQSWTFDGTKWVASGTAVMPPLATGDNRIINGDMRIDQRNNGVGGTAGGYTIDRWTHGTTQVGKGTWQRLSSPVAGFPYALSFASSSAYAALATDVFQFTQSIEADMVSDFAWGTAGAQPVTLSFWAYSSLSGTFGGSIGNDGSTRCYPFSFVLVAATWTKVVVTIPGDTAGTWVMSGNAKSVVVHFDLGCGANFRGAAGSWQAGNIVGVTGAVSVVGTNGATFYLTGVKLEVGSVATPYNRQTMAKSLADCQRYYEASSFVTAGSAGAASNGVSYFQPFVVTKRATPTVTPVNTTMTNVTGGTFNNIQIGGFQPYAVTSTIGGYAWAGSYTASAEL